MNREFIEEVYEQRYKFDLEQAAAHQRELERLIRNYPGNKQLLQQTAEKYIEYDAVEGGGMPNFTPEELAVW